MAEDGGAGPEGVGCPQWAHTDAALTAFLVEPLSPTPLLGGEGSPPVLLCPQDRDNSPSSCAGLFIASHIGFDWPGVWVHLDIAAPVHAVSRGPCVCPPLPYKDAPLAGQLVCFPLAWLLPPARASRVPLWLKLQAELIGNILCRGSYCPWPSLPASCGPP